MPSIQDVENDNVTTINWKLEAPDSYACNCIDVKVNFTLGNDTKVNLTLLTVELEIDRKYISEADIGDYKIIFDLRDDYNHKYFLKSIYETDFKIEYGVPDPSLKVIKPKPPKVENDSIEVEQVEEIDPSLIKDLRVEIFKFTLDGEVTLRFNQETIVPTEMKQAFTRQLSSFELDHNRTQ